MKKTSLFCLVLGLLLSLFMNFSIYGEVDKEGFEKDTHLNVRDDKASSEANQLIDEQLENLENTLDEMLSEIEGGNEVLIELIRKFDKGTNTVNSK